MVKNIINIVDEIFNDGIITKILEIDSSNYIETIINPEFQDLKDFNIEFLKKAYKDLLALEEKYLGLERITMIRERIKKDAKENLPLDIYKQICESN